MSIFILENPGGITGKKLWGGGGWAGALHRFGDCRSFALLRMTTFLSDDNVPRLSTSLGMAGFMDELDYLSVWGMGYDVLGSDRYGSGPF
ncbi:MAG: hypothetical protein ACP5M4_11675 [Acidobacteriaceae bacterium]